MAITNFIDTTYISAANISVNPKFSVAGSNLNKTNHYIDQAMYEDVRPLLGDELYWDLCQNPSATTKGSYPDLLNGVEYSYGGYNYQHKGVKYLTLIFWLARYRYFSKDVDSSHGFSQSQETNFKNTSPSRDINLYNSHNREAYKIWEGIRSYLIRNSSDYTLWLGGGIITPNEESPIVIRRATLR